MQRRRYLLLSFISISILIINLSCSQLKSTPAQVSLLTEEVPVSAVQVVAPTNQFSIPVVIENYPGVIGWEADRDGVIAYIDGSFSVRDGKDTRYGFGIYNQPASLKWYNSEGFLPCLVTEFERDQATVKIMNFGDQVSLNDKDYVAIYSRVSIFNHGSNSIQLAPSPTKGLVPLTGSSETVQPGETIQHDYVVAADRFGKNYAWPSDAALAGDGGWDQHYAHMKEYWTSRLGEIVDITRLPDERLINAYKAGFIYTQIIRDGDDIHVGENGYDMVFDHDSLGILTTLFTLGDFSDAKALLSALQAQTQYDDAKYKNSWVWALYLLKTGDVDFVRDHFAKIKSNTHKIEDDLSGPGGIIKVTNDIDAHGLWTVDDASALFGLTTYAYLAGQLGEASEAAWARDLYSRLLTAVNARLEQTQTENDIGYLPCDLNQSNNANRCRDPKDANWASMLLFGRWYWDGYLWGAQQSGPMLDSIDATYAYGFNRLVNVLPEHTYGGYPGNSTGYNAGYGRSGLRGVAYRSEAILDYIYMIDQTQSSPFGWWENINPPGNTPWEGTHPSSGGGACPHMWGQSFATTGLLDSLIVEKSDGTVLVGRGVPDAWVAEGQVIELTNYPISDNRRIGIRVEGLPGNQVRLALTGDQPKGKVVFNLPIFLKGIASTSAGIFDPNEGAVILDPGITKVVIKLLD